MRDLVSKKPVQEGNIPLTKGLSVKYDYTLFYIRNIFDHARAPCFLSIW